MNQTKTHEELLLERIANAVEQIAANTNDTRHLLKDIRQIVYGIEAKEKDVCSRCGRYNCQEDNE